MPLIATALKDCEIFEAINAAVIAAKNRKHEILLRWMFPKWLSGLNLRLKFY